MPDPIDALVQQWKHNPSSALTVALCDALRARPMEPLVHQVGELAAKQHMGDVTVLIAVARMYIASKRLGDAQTVLVGAGKQAPRDARIYRWLGEVLLRRGDAARAAKVLERSIALGGKDESSLWRDRARAYQTMQTSAGDKAVAEEVALATQRAEREPDDSLSEMPTAVKPLPLAKAVTSGSSPAAVSTAPPIPPRISEALEASARPSDSASSSAVLPGRGANGKGVPYPRDVLDALALSGVFEPPDTRPMAAGWAHPGAGPKRKGTATLIGAMVFFLAAGSGTYAFYRQKRAKDHQQAEALLGAVESRLRAGKPDSLNDVEKALARVLKLESRSPRAALDWARERALMGLVKGGADVAFEDAMTRAKDVGIPEEKYAFARVASFLLQGDTEGAAAVLPRWDGPAASDPWYQLVTGATLERAGDLRARERYAAAVKADPELVVAEVNLARVTALDGDPEAAMQFSQALRARLPDRAEPVALVALAWGRDPMRESARLPPEVDEVERRLDELPTGLKFVPFAVAALRALDRHGLDDARGQVQRGLALTESPGAAVWLGAIALLLGDESLARKAALGALGFSAVYEPARALAAQVALHAGRLDEALKATEELEPTSPSVAVVRAAAAYERVDSDGLARALDALRPDDRKTPFVSALSTAPAALKGKLGLDSAKLVALATDDPPWSDLVAMDAALDAGDLTTADAVAAAWGKEAETAALRALRLARLARYEGRLDAADALSLVAVEHATVTPRVLCERIFTLVARNRAADAGPLLARYPLVLGRPLATWLGAYAAGGDVPKAKTATLDLPADGVPLASRVVVAAALGAMKDRKRGTGYVRALLATGSLHPDLVAAALSLGFKRVEHGKRHPTYE